MILPKFKIRCSAIGSIMGGAVGLSETQERKLKGFQDKIKAGKDLTELQKVENDRLVDIRNNPKPTKGMMTYCQSWIKEQASCYNRRKEIKSKYLSKGNEVEDDSILFLNSQLLTGYKKNEDFFENDFMTGTPDINSNIIIDMKNSWDYTSFPLFAEEIENKDYFYQLQGYMELCDKEEAMLVYCLMDTPDHLIEKEARSKAWELGGHWEDHYSDCHKFMTYGDIDPALKIKKFSIERDRRIITEVENRVEMCREYISELVKSL